MCFAVLREQREPGDHPRRAGAGRVRRAAAGPRGFPLRTPAVPALHGTAQKGVPLPLSSGVRAWPAGEPRDTAGAAAKGAWPPAHPPLGGPPSTLLPRGRKKRGGFA